MKKDNSLPKTSSSKSLASIDSYSRKFTKIYSKGLIGTIIILCLIAIIIPSLLISLSTIETSKSKSTAYSAQIDNIILQKLAIVHTIAAGLSDRRLTDEDDILAYLNAMVSSYDKISAVYSCYGDNSYLISGTLLCDENFSNVTDNIWYKETLLAPNGIRISQPAIDNKTGKTYLTISQIVYNKTSIASVVGVDIYIDDIISVVKEFSSDDGYVYIATANNSVLGHPDGDFLSSSKTSITHNSVILNTDSSGTFSFIASSDCKNSDWFVVYVHSAIPLVITILIISAICIALSLILIIVSHKLTVKKIKKLVLPLKSVTARATAIANGDLSSVTEENNISREILDLNTALSEIATAIKENLSHIVRVVNAITNGTTNVSIPTSFKGEFSIIRDALLNIKKTINKSASDIDAKSLSLTEYANEIDNLIKTSEEKSSKEAALLNDIANDLATVNLHSHRINMTADAVKEAASITNNNLLRGNREMKELLVAMEQIEKSYNSIASLVYEINGLSEQTNLLSLNASIEAARMGEAGKEYASVADEINMLSSACSKAINKIELLINDSNTAVDKGRDMVNSTSESISKGITDSQNTKYNIDEIVFIVEQQQETMENINNNISVFHSVLNDDAIQENEN